MAQKRFIAFQDWVSLEWGVASRKNQKRLKTCAQKDVMEEKQVMRWGGHVQEISTSEKSGFQDFTRERDIEQALLSSAHVPEN